MAGRYSQWRKLRGDLDRPELVDYGKRLLGYLDNQRKLSGNMSAHIKRTLPDGSVVMARFNGDQPEVYVQDAASEGDVEDIYFLYVTSAAGLLIYDMSKRSIAQTVTGLQDYEVDAVSARGDIVFLTGGAPFNGLGVRADLKVMEATSTGGLYSMDSAERGAYLPFSGDLYEYEFVTGYPALEGATLSPDGKTILWFYVAEFSESGVALAGIGGYFVADAVTLAPKRGVIRTHGQTSAAVWAPDSEHFFLTSCYDTERPDGVWWIEAGPPGYWRASDAASPEDMYIVKYTAAGEQVAAVHVVNWISAAGVPSPDGMAAVGNHLFVAYYSDPFAVQTLAAYAMDDLSLAGSVDLAWVSGGFVDVCAMGNGNIALVYAAGGARVFRFVDGAFELVEDTGNAVLGTNAVRAPTATLRQYRNNVIQKFPDGGAAPTPPLSFYYVRAPSNFEVYGFNSFLNDEGELRAGGYVLDMTDDAPNERYRIARVGSRRTPQKKAA